MAVIVIYIYIPEAFFCKTFLYTQKSKNQSFLCTDLKKTPDTESSLEQQKMEFRILKKVNDSTATKLCANLLNNRNKKFNYFSARHNLVIELCSALK